MGGRVFFHAFDFHDHRCFGNWLAFAQFGIIDSQAYEFEKIPDAASRQLTQ